MKKKYAVFIIFIVLVACLLAGCHTVTALSFQEETFTVGVGKEITPDVVIKPSNMDYTLSVSNETIASVDGHVIKGLKTGIVTLTATAGDSVAKATLIVSDLAEPGGITFVPVHSFYVTFSIVNFKDVGLGSAVLENQLYTEGEIVTRPLPMYTGYEVKGWYVDTLCTQEFDAEANPVVANLNLYCKAYEKSNSFTVDAEGYITGFLYKNLPHSSVVSLPASISGVEIKGVAGKAFQGDKYIKTVRIPACYEVIGNFAFAGCTELTTVEIAQGSILDYVGRFAFSYTAEEVKSEGTTSGEDDEDKEEEEPEIVPGGSACTKLTSINLPDTVTEIGSFAFYDCSSLKLTKLPVSLKTVQYGVFSGTNISDINLINVTEIQAYAFMNCKALYMVRHTENVVSCGANAFYNTVLYNKVKSSPFLAYADTILFACNDMYGKNMGGKLVLPNNVTLIADGTFVGSGQSELTLYIKKSGVILGDNAFKTDNGVCIAVEDMDMYEEYRDAVLLSDNAEYVPLLCIREEYVIDDKDAVNYGKHTVLRFPTTGEVYYDKFEVGTYMLDGKEMRKSPEVIDLTKLPCANKIVRINTRAINLGEGYLQGGNLKRLVLPRYLKEIAFLAIVNCYVLTDIDCLACNEAPDVVPNSIQFTTVGRNPEKGGTTAAKIYVPNGNYEHYRSKWEGCGDIYNLIEVK